MIPATTSRRPRRLRLEIREICAVVIGYGMAAIFFRAFWPAASPPTWVIAPAVVLYLWLGLALSGPILLFRRRADEERTGQASPAPTTDSGTRTWAEWAWLFVGGYWIVLGLFVIPNRLHSFRAGDVLLFGLLPVLAALLFRRIGAAPAGGRPVPLWTHAAAVWLLATWPVAWGCMVAVVRGLH